MRRHLLPALLAAFALTAPVPAADAKADKYWVFVGTGGKGIYRTQFDPATGKLGQMELAAEASNPNFVAIHPNGKFLYAVANISVEGKTKGGVIAYALDPKTGALTKLNEQPSGGSGPCHVNLDPAGKTVLVANYNSGSAAAFPIAEDGSLKPAGSVVQHEGKGANPGRQEGPHAHSVNVSKDGRYAIIADLGTDKLFVYKLDPEKGTLTPNDPPALETKPGAGPRHFAFHPNAPLAFVINELNNTLSSLSYDAATGTFKTLKTVKTLPQGWKGMNTTAEVVVHPNGKFVYGSNRGHNSVVGFKLDEATGDLTLIGHATEGINTPRNFNVDPTGQYLLVASQRGNQVAVFKIDPSTGELTPTAEKAEVNGPICIRFLPVPR